MSDEMYSGADLDRFVRQAVEDERERCARSIEVMAEILELRSAQLRTAQLCADHIRAHA